jgi:histidinol-phosphate phosphatase family protein
MNDFAFLKSHSLFIDRDGVINRRIFGGYVTKISEFDFLPGVFESFRIFNRVFNKIIVVTNQQGVGKGLMTVSDLEKIHAFMTENIGKNGGRIDAVYYCTMLANIERNCRKPDKYMALEAKDDFPEINFSKSIMVGDSESDILFGKNSGMKTILIGDEKLSDGIVPDFRFPVLLDFAKRLEKEIINREKY